MKIQSILNGFSTLNVWVGKLVSWLFLALIATVSIDLFARFFTGRSTRWAFDINYMIYATNFMLAGGYALYHNSHVRVDVVYQQLSARTRAIIEVVFYLLIMFPLCGIMLYSTWIDFMSSVRVREVSILSSWNPPVYHFKAVMPLAFALLILQSIALFIPNLVTAIRGRANDDK